MTMTKTSVVVLLVVALSTTGTLSLLPTSSVRNDPVAVTRRIAFCPNSRSQQRLQPLPQQKQFLATSTSCLFATAKTSSSSTPQAASVSAEEDIEFDEDEFLEETGGKLGSYQDYLSRMQQLARSTSTDPTAVQKANQVFDEMLQAFLVTEDSALWPNTDIYNLLMETHAYSSDPKGAEQVDTILTRMEDFSVANIPRPNLESYAKLMEAWSRRRQIDKVKAVVDRIISTASSSSTTSTNTNRLQPDTYIYNKLIRAYGMAGQPHEARHILDQILLKGYLEQDDASLRPNAKTWTHVLRAYAAAAENSSKRGQRQEQPPPQQLETPLETIQDLMRQMTTYARRNEENDWKPGVDAYNALLRCLSVYSTSSSSSRPQQEQEQEHDGGTKGASSGMVSSASKQAESVLYGMIEQYQENNNDETIKPNDESFFHVMNAYRGETDAGVAIKVEKLLELQRALASTSSTSLSKSLTASSSSRLEQPSLRTCNSAIAAMSRTRDPQKAMRAQRLVQRIKDSGAAAAAAGGDEASSSSFQPNLTTYRNLLNTCAYSGSEATHTSPEDRLQTFQIAVETLNEIRRLYPHQEKPKQQRQQQQQQQMDSSIYSLFLRACGNLMPSNRKRDAVVESVFSMCCKDGLVNDAVLREFEKTSSEELQLKTLGGFLEDGVQPPKQWSRNCSSK